MQPYTTLLAKEATHQQAHTPLLAKEGKQGWLAKR
jgi:hypothetical protein